MARFPMQALVALDAWELALRDLIALVEARATSTEALTRALERADGLARPALIAIESDGARDDSELRIETRRRAHQCFALVSIAKTAAASQMCAANRSLERVRDVRRTLDVLEAPVDHGSLIDESG